ncbi:hypothetical protein NDU88_002384 [Pleurodeles waltl]|uniref:Uncharacterized protein n=1 Tax=Pleurodeles waltl TaxID=8319 RepID=A0AAV7W212_PLEWA|nr:hypothetical protein NDU88_002384 [Pleurodeles waltl]
MGLWQLDRSKCWYNNAERTAVSGGQKRPRCFFCRLVMAQFHHRRVARVRLFGALDPEIVQGKRFGVLWQYLVLNRTRAVQESGNNKSALHASQRQMRGLCVPRLSMLYRVRARESIILCARCPHTPLVVPSLWRKHYW